jgi:hypothetical protein
MHQAPMPSADQLQAYAAGNRSDNFISLLHLT